MDLDELFKKYGSDKDRNGYSATYHSLFKNIRDREIDFMEIGIGTMIPGVYSSMVGYALPGYAPGGSLRAWRDFFVNGKIVGVDVQPDTQFTEERIETHLCDTMNSEATKELFEKLDGRKFDVILDDGAHYDECQLSTFKNFFPHVKPGGYYIIEDVVRGSRILTDFYSTIQEIAGDSLIFCSYVIEEPNPKVPIMIISKRG